MEKMTHNGSILKLRQTMFVLSKVCMALVLPVMVLFVSPLIAGANLVDLKYVSKSGEFLDKCSPEAKETRFTVQGPGVLHFKLTLKPYRSGIWTVHEPVSWTMYKADGGHMGWGLVPNFGHYNNGGLPYKVTQAGKPVKGNPIDGLPLEKEWSALVSANKYDVGVRLFGTCAMQGSTYTQWGQVNRLTVSFSPGSSGTAKPKTGTSGAGKPDGGTAKASKTLFDNGNSGSVHNRPTQPTVFTLGKPTRITLIQNYHWNNGKGAAPGSISLKNDKGQTVDIWPASGRKGQGGMPNAYWVCKPDVVLAPGRYAVGDSDPGTWAQNSGSGGAGMTHIEGHLEQ